MKNLLISFIFIVQLLQMAAAAAEELSYSGRLVNANGSPVTGLVDLKFDVAYSGAPTVIICTKTVTGVALSNGVFHVSLDIENSDCSPSKAFEDVLSDVPNNESVILQVTDSTNGKVYPHQAFKSVPLSIQSNIAKTLSVKGTDGQVLKLVGGKWVASNGGGSGSITEIQTGSGLSGGPITSSGTISIATNGVTSSHILDGTISNADINASAGIARSKIAGSLANHVVINDGAGLLSAVSHLPVNLGGTGAGTANDARTNLGLGDAATRNVGLNSGNILLADEVPSCLAHQKIQKTAVAPYLFSCVNDNDSADASKLPLLGGTMLGAINMGGFAITNLIDPVNPQDAATRNYVHTYVTSELLGVSESQWLDSASDIYFNAGKVGVGTSTPNVLLDVYGGALHVGMSINAPTVKISPSASVDVIGTDAAPGSIKVTSWSSNASPGQVMGSYKFGVGISDHARIEGFAAEDHSVAKGTGMRFFTTSNGTATQVERLRIDHNGNIGIGTTNPDTKLHVSGAGQVASFVSTAALGPLSGAGLTSYTFDTPTASGQRLGYLLFGSKGGGNGLYHPAGINGYSESSWTTEVSHPTFLNFETTPTGSIVRTERMRISSNGNVGIGTMSPGAKLEVAGQVKITGGAPGAGKVLTSDGAGLATWETPSAPTSGSINSSHIQDGSIVDADINASAAIAQSKIANLTTDLAGKQAADPELAAIAALTSDGILVKNGAASMVTRTIVGAAGRTFVSNGNGSTGNPTVDISNSLLPSPVAGDVGKLLKTTGPGVSVWSNLASGDITTALGFTPINKAGDTISSGTVEFNGTGALRINYTPSVLTDAVNKQYVDNALSGHWTLASGNLYRNSGNVGVGTTTPIAQLSVMRSGNGDFGPNDGILVGGGAWANANSSLSIANGGRYSTVSNLGSQFSLIGVNTKYNSTSDAI